MLQASLTPCPIGHVLADRRAAALLDQLPACEVVLDIVGDLFTHRCQLKHLDFDEGIVSLLGKLPIFGRLVPEIVRLVHVVPVRPCSEKRTGVRGKNSLTLP